ncbi:MAG: putative serine protease PepD, partial [Mycobacterium sp.]|nr:putative serine protease PepD [Mycobacterium sp.]
MGQQYSGYAPQNRYQQPYDWRYATQSPHDSYRDMRHTDAALTVPIPRVRRRSRVGVVIFGAAAVAVTSGTVGALVLSGQHHGAADLKAAAPALSALTPSAPTQQKAGLPSGSVEQVAAKVLPSVVKLQIDMGQGSEEGSGIVLSEDGLILTNNHVVAAANKSAGAQDGPTVLGGDMDPQPSPDGEGHSGQDV